MSFNYVKLKECPNCPKCEKKLKLPRTKKKDDSQNAYYMQSKRVEGAENVNFWFNLEEIGTGEMHCICSSCHEHIEFDIKHGEITGSKSRR